MRSSYFKPLFVILAGLLLLAGLLIRVLPAQADSANPTIADTPMAVIQQAWKMVGQSNTYTFDTHIEQTTYPLPALSNVGRQPQVDNVYLNGRRDQEQDLLEMTLWQNARGTAESGLTVRSQNGRSYSRNAAGEWEEQTGANDLFAPGGDPLTFLQTAKNIAPLGADARQLGDLTLTYEKYTFDLDTTAYARVMRQQLTQQLEQYGSLPAGMTLETPAIYQKMTGQGMVWLDEAGLPRRLEMTLELPPQGDTGRTTAVITTDLSGFDLTRIDEVAVPFWQTPQTWLTIRQAEIVAGLQLGMRTAVWLLVSGLFLLFVVTYWRDRRFYMAVAAVIIISMLSTPFLQEVQAASFRDNLQAAQDAATARQAEAAAQADLQAELTANDWNPHQNPLATTETTAVTIGETAVAATTSPLASALVATNAITDTTDTDGDGLIDSDEEHYGTCPYLGAPNGCLGVTDPTDTDGDSLSDGVEINELGTDPDNSDTDHDSIADNLEISGFSYNGQTWYLNPLEADSNKDGLIDGQECRVRTTIVAGEFDPAGICPDTDGDGTPDLFDNDNDGDGVDDATDASPFAVSNIFYDADNPLELSIDNLALDKTVFVDFQLQPQTATNLNLYNHVLDWPSGDFEGQIQRTLDTTWANTNNSDLRSDAANAANGDIRLTPMLEITMPYTNGHYANLPITTTAPAVRDINDAVESWLDKDRIEPMGVSLSDSGDDDGVVNGYLPITQVSGPDGTPQAFAARMLYRPSQGTNGRADWGEAHQVRLIWFVQMITDQCPEGYDDSREVENGTVTYACIDPDTGATAAREDALTIAHIYPDNWRLTGLTVSEEHDYDLAILYEDPAQDTDLTADDQLMVASWNLNNGFLNGRDCDTIDGNGVCQENGQRDVTVANLPSVTPNWFSGINYLTVDTFLDYDHSAYFAYLVGTEVEPILENNFGGHTDVIPTLLYAQDHTYRRLTLDSQAASPSLVNQNGNSLQLDLNPADVPLETSSSLSWAPYQYVDGAWQAADIQSYLTRLDNRLQAEDFYTPEEDTEAAREEAELRRTWVQMYYSTLWQGISALTQIATTPINNRTLDIDIPETTYEPLVLPGTDFGAILIGLAFLDIVFYGTPQNQITQLSFRGNTSVAAPAFGLALLATAAAMAVFVAGVLSNNQEWVRGAQVALAIISIVVVSVYAINALMALNNAALGIAVTASNQASAYASITPAGVAISLAIVWGMFFYQMNYLPYTEYNIALSLAIATTIVILALFITSLLGFGIIGILLSLVDSIFLLLNKKGPTQYVVEYLAQSLYSIDSSVTNLGSADRLEIAVEDITFFEPEDGFRSGRDIQITMGITNTIDFSTRLAVRAGGINEIASHNTFSYTLQEEQIPRHFGMQWVDDREGDQWTFVGGGFRTSAVNDIGATLPSAGLNQGLEIYYTEAFRTGIYQCWSFIVEDIDCNWNSLWDSAHIPLIDTLVFDVFPETVARFADMDWAGPAISFPIQADEDGDGLTWQSGTDPNDRLVDTDGDGLNDFYEISNGYDPIIADEDSDGLIERDELRYGTNPLLADTDGDGLNDHVEAVEGWLIVYNGNQLTRVWSDPLIVDVDDDGLTDRDEMIFGFNPWVSTDPSLILNLVQFDDLGVVETAAPELLLQFEDNENSTAFNDRSGEGNHAVCDGAACPAVTTNGRYGQALEFDGTNDYLDLGEIVNPASQPFSAAMWFNVSDYSNRPLLLQQTDRNGTGRGWLNLENDGRMRSYLGGSSLNGSTVVTLNSWHHVALTYDGTTLRLYLDGVEESSAVRTLEASDGSLWLGRQKSSSTQYFNGGLDDLVIFDEALSVGAIADVMNGRFNPNDRLLTPGSELTYQATVTNTSSTTAAGFLTGESSIVAPEIPYPDAAYSFESSQRLVYFANNSGTENYIICIDDGTCPTAGVAGHTNNAIAFDGVDDVATFPFFGQRNPNFELWVDSLPPSGQVATIFDTADELLYDFDLLLNDSGKLLLVVDGVVQFTSTSTIPIGSWRHISYDGFYLRINGSIDGGDFKVLDNWNLGHGILGNNAAGSAPFHGRLDEFRNYELDESVTYDGTIYYDSQANENHVTCSGATCPQLTATNAGYSGRAVVFDGVDDFLSQPGNFTANETTVSLYVNPASYPASGERAYLYDSNASGVFRTVTFDLYLDENGQLTLNSGPDYTGGPDRETTYDTVIPRNQWSKVEVVFDRQSGATTRYRMYLDVDNVRDPVYAEPCVGGSGDCVYTARVSSGRIGNNTAGDAPFDGMLDQLELQISAIDFEVPLTDVGYDNLANEFRAAVCTDVSACPTVGNGRYDQGLVLDGTDDYLPLDFVLDPASGPFSIALWFNVSDLSNRPILLQQTDGTGTGRGWLSLETNGQLRTFLGGSGLNSTTLVTTNSWHHAALIYDGTTVRLYLDGVLENSAVRTMEASDGTMWVGRQKSDNTRYFAGHVDELIILPTAVAPEGVQLLMDSVWPLIAVPDPFVPFSAGPLTSQTVSGVAPVSNYVGTSHHRFDQEVEAALVLQALPEYPVIDDNSGDLQLFIPFEDGPGSTVFDNLISYASGNGYGSDLEALCSDTLCPTVGVRGQVGRAAYFDGRDDSLLVDAEGRSGPEDVTAVSVWVNAEKGTILDINRGPTSSDRSLDITLKRILTNDGSTQRTLAYDAPRNEWFHLVVSIDEINNVGTIYVNGTLVATGTLFTGGGLDAATEFFSIGANYDGSNLLQGYLDDLRLYSTQLSQADVTALYETSAPLLRFEFDEDDEATHFTDNSVNQYVGNPHIINATIDGEAVSQLNPIIGTPGRIGNGIVLDGTGYVAVDAPQAAALTESFTIMGWIKPSDLGGNQQILSAARENSENGWAFRVRDNQLGLATYGVQNFYTGDLLQNDVWQHVAVVFDSGYDATFYINGENVGTVNGSSPIISNLDDVMRIGATSQSGAAGISTPFKGSIDELAVHGRELSDAEIYGIYLRELRWYRDKATTYLTIDTDAPTIELVSDATYWPEGYVQLAVATTDATSAVTLLDFGLQAPGESDFTWKGAPPCAESNDNGAAWCPYFDTADFSGEGAYELQFRAVDSVGNETVSSVHTLYVDATPPTARGGWRNNFEPDEPVPMLLTRIDDSRWTVPLSGDFSDPHLVRANSMAGSGVITESVRVQLVDEVGGIVSGTPQKPIITGSDWEIEYELNGAAPQGNYNLMITVEDVVGNQQTRFIQKINLDGRLPNVDLYAGSLSTDVISQTTILSGTITDLAEWSDVAVEHHFAEPAGTTIFYNTAETQIHSACSNCPTAGQPGLFGDAVQFDGVDDTIIIPSEFDPITATLAAAVWINPASVAGPYTILAQENGSGTGRSWLAINSAGTLETDLGGAVLSGTNPIVVGEWQHVAVTYDGDVVRLYHNGRLDAAASRTMEPADGNMRLGNSPTGLSPFSGLMDEFNLYHRTLTHIEVYALANDDGQGARYLMVGVEPADFLTDTISVPPDTSGELYVLGWESVWIDNQNELASSWQYALPTDLEGFYELHLRGGGSGEYGSEYGSYVSRDKVPWRGLIDMVSPTITVTARHLTVNSMPVTEYSFIFNDFLLDETSYQHPCAVGEWITESYNDANLPHDGQPYEASGICQVATHETSRDFTACDAVGHCTTVTVTPADLPQICGISENQTYNFEDVSIFIEPNGLGDIACLQVGHVKANHPAATAGIRTDSYWIIEALNDSDAAASGFTATLTMQVPFTPDTNDKLCRYTGSGWDCKANSFNAGNKTITRNNVTEFSPWAIGNDVGPTAVTLHSVSASSASPLWVVILLLMMWGITAVLWRRRKSLTMPLRIFRF